MGRGVKGSGGPGSEKRPRLTTSTGREMKETQLLELTDKHMYFCKRYVLNGGVASKAAKESGFSEWYCQTVLLKNNLVKEQIDQYRAERAKKFEVNADRVIQELVRVAFGSLGDFIRLQPDGTPIIDCSEVGADEMAALSEITQDIYYERTSSDPEDDAEPVKKTKIKLHPKLQALEQLGRIFKMFGDSSITDTDTPEQKAAKLQALVRSMKVQEGL